MHIARNFFALAILAFAMASAACDDPTEATAIVENHFDPDATDGGASPKTASGQPVFTVYKAWYSTALFADPIAAGGASGETRIVGGTPDYAYALLAPDYDPSAGPPASLVAVRTRDKIAGARGETLRIVFSPNTVRGPCSGEAPLTQDEYDFITQRIFPADFDGGATLAAAPCTGAADAGTDG